MSLKTLGNINRNCKPSLPGVNTKIIIGCIEDVKCWPSPEEGTHVINEPLLSGSQYEWEVQKNTPVLIIDPIGDNGSEGWKSELTFFVKRLTPEVSYMLNGIVAGEFYVIAKDKNGYRRLLGDQYEGATIKIKEQTTNKNGYEIVVTWESPYLPYYLNGDSIVIPTPVFTPNESINDSLVLNLDATQSYYQEPLSYLTGSVWCGKWEISSINSQGQTLTETISFNFDSSSSSVDAAIVSQLENVGLSNGADILGDHIYNVQEAVFNDIESLTVKLKVWLCANGETGGSCADSLIDEQTFDLSRPLRMSQVDDSNLFAVSFSPAGSLRCDGSPADLDFDIFTYPIYGEDAFREYNTNGNETNRTVVGPKLFLFELKIQGDNLLEVTWNNSIVTDAGDRVLIENLFQVSQGGFVIDKLELDHILKGRKRLDLSISSNSIEGTNIPQVATDGWELVGSATPYLRNNGVGSITKSWTADGETFNEIYDSGVELVLQNAIMIQVGGNCPIETSLPEDAQHTAQKGIKRLKSLNVMLQSKDTVIADNDVAELQLELIQSDNNNEDVLADLGVNLQSFGRRYWFCHDGNSMIDFDNGNTAIPDFETTIYNEEFPNAVHIPNFNYTSHIGMIAENEMFLLFPNFDNGGSFTNRKIEPLMYSRRNLSDSIKIKWTIIVKDIQIESEITKPTSAYSIENLNTSNIFESFSGFIGSDGLGSHFKTISPDRIKVGDVLRATFTISFDHNGTSYDIQRVFDSSIVETF